MADKQEILKERIETIGLFDFKAVYAYANSYLVEDDFTVTEEAYTEKISGEARDVNVKWKCIKEYSDYFKVWFDIKYDIRDMKEVEVEIDGKKRKMNKGRFYMEIKGSLVKDMESRWDATPFNRFLRDIYNKYIIPSRIDVMEDKVKMDVKQLKESVKAFLDLTGRRDKHTTGFRTDKTS